MNAPQHSAAARFAVKIGEFDALIAELSAQRAALFGASVETAGWIDVFRLGVRVDALRIAANPKVDE